MRNSLQEYYLDNNSTTPCDPRISQLIQELTSNSAIANPHSSEHAWGWASEQIIEQSSEIIASRYNALPDEVVYTSGATEANNLAILGLAQTNKIEGHGKKKIIVSAIEHKCVLNATHHASIFYDIEMVICPVNRDGIIDLEFLKQSIDENTLLVSVMAVNNEIGSEQPISDIGSLTKKYGVIFHVDAAQASYFDIDMVKDKVDLLSISGHKMYAPVGIGAILISEDIPIKLTPIIHGGGQQRGRRSGTLSPVLCRALAEAVKILSNEGLAEKKALIKHRQKFIGGLKEANLEYLINGNMEKRHPGNLNIQLPSKEASILINNIQPKMAISTGSACNSGTIKASYVLKAMGLDSQAIHSSLRLCFGRFNLKEEPSEYIKLIAKYL